jgi:hypothetical protein
VDLTTAGASGTANGAIFTQVDVAPAGTGVIDSFLRIEGAASGGAETGFNTDARPVQFDEKTDPNFTRSLLLSAVPTVVKNGITYREFLLDNNEPAAASKTLLSLDSLQVFLSPVGNPTGVSLANPAAALGALVYSLDAGADNTVLMDASLAQGSGHYDVTIDIPDAAFAASANPFVVFLATFGVTTPTGAGFEEFAVAGTSGDQGGSTGGGPVPIPLPAALTSGLSTLGLLAGLGAMKRTRRAGV